MQPPHPFGQGFPRPAHRLGIATQCSRSPASARARFCSGERAAHARSEGGENTGGSQRVEAVCRTSRARPRWEVQERYHARPLSFVLISTCTAAPLTVDLPNAMDLWICEVLRCFRGVLLAAVRSCCARWRGRPRRSDIAPCRSNEINSGSERLVQRQKGQRHSVAIDARSRRTSTVYRRDGGKAVPRVRCAHELVGGLRGARRNAGQ